MAIKLKHNHNEFEIDALLWDRDAYFINFENYWSRIVGSIGQQIAERTTNNWGNFNHVRTTAIKILGINPETLKSSDSAPIKILPFNTFPSLLTSALMELFKDKSREDLNDLFDSIVYNVRLESEKYTSDSIIKDNVQIISHIGNKAKQILITNDDETSNNLFIKNCNLETAFHKVHANINKEGLKSLFTNNSYLITDNPYLKKYYLKKKFNNVLLVNNLNELTIEESKTSETILVNIDGASRGNPGPAGIGIVFYKNREELNQISEFIGTQTNNFAEYTALIRALEACLDKGFNDIEIRSDSELVVKQINKIYKVKDADIKELYNRATSLIEQIPNVKIVHVRREENLKADKLANNALKKLTTDKGQRTTGNL